MAMANAQRARLREHPADGSGADDIAEESALAPIPEVPEIVVEMSDDSDPRANGMEYSEENPLLEHPSPGKSEETSIEMENMNGGGVPRKPLTSLVMPSPNSFSDNNTPKTPKEKVRDILEEHFGFGEGSDEDLTPQHALFCQMDVLCSFEDGDVGWRESARWLKYEEKVEMGDRWSKPHVATTALHSLFEVRKDLAEKTVLLDLDAPHGCLHQVVELAVDQIAKDQDLSDEKKTEVLKVLLKPHKHQHRKVKKDEREDEKLPHGGEDHSKTSTPRRRFPPVSPSQRTDTLTPGGTKPFYHFPEGMTSESLSPHKSNKKLMKKVPRGAEAANILVGKVDFLDKPISCFIRLLESAKLADMTEVDLPTRFIYLLLAPAESEPGYEYEEVGRGVAALFTDRVFCQVAYKASTRDDILDGVDEFIDDLTVLPPSIWDPTTRLEPPEKTISEDLIKARMMGMPRHIDVDAAFSEHDEDKTLKRTGRLFGGMIADIKRRYPKYWSDIKDGGHIQCVASIFFLYFACITPIVTFGGLLGDATDGYMGTMETILSGFICGMIYHVFAGQPLTIMGATGPLLVFESILYLFCKDNGWEFMSFRWWIALWICFILLIVVAFDLSSLVRYITRFSEESFAVLISLIFIFEAWKKLFGIWKTHPIELNTIRGREGLDWHKCHCTHPVVGNSTAYQPHANHTAFQYSVNGSSSNVTTDYHPKYHPIFDTFNWSQLVYEDCITYHNRIVVNHDCVTEKECLSHGWVLEGSGCYVHMYTHSVPDVFFLCCFLFIGTFVIAYFFRTAKTSSFFPTIVRYTLADFAVMIAIIICTGVDAILGLDTPKLSVPDQFKPTRSDRGWIINPMTITYWWLPLVAAVPALLATILIFLDQQITAVIVNRKEHKLKKGHGYHLDLFILAFLIFICGVMGLPWFVAATVRTVTHVRSLMKTSEMHAPGEKPQFLGVREQRVTGIGIHILIGISVMITGILKYIPMAVLYGVFLYMGVTSLSGVQFVDRILILFMPAKYQPDHIYLRHVKTTRVHIYTIIQIVCMATMWAVKSIKKISLLFPLMIMALCFIRKAMDYLFTQQELQWLDHILPDEYRRRREDKKKLETEESEKFPGQVDTEHENGYFGANIRLADDKKGQPEEWSNYIAKRDYGVGKKQKLRRRSQGVIDRYHSSREDMGHQPLAEDSGGSRGTSTTEVGEAKNRRHSVPSAPARKLSL